ncbi:MULTISPECIES: ROK family protein [unclassified Paenibacillus]|nr:MULTISPECIES: ROK family protein [unclassified Paenibacillus]MBD8837124.1 ROK family protein [Paenibacillus sp. CFBP 13594]PRA07630.1 glucokinase [Paenibacillus sp. MYb63]PRA51275.1 glucokinase [Paenibacillus sp. MYb67]QZN74397.1 ROK family protein [Paenibacillus sp. DR312]
MRKYIIGIDLGGTNIKSAIFNLEFQKIHERSDPTEAAKGPSHVLNRMVGIIQEMLTYEGIQPESILCMGMGIPGLLDPEQGLSLFSPNFPDWENIHVVNHMINHFEFPAYIDNDVRVNLYGEWLFGAGSGYKNLILITLGTGLGSGIVNDGKVLYGTTSSAGEIGHMNMYREGRPCRCGSSGCLGRYVSAIGMVKTLTDKLEEGRSSMIMKWVKGDWTAITARMISEAYDLGDSLAVEVMHETGEILGFGLSNVINLFNPEVIIVGGGMSAAGDRLLNTVRDTVKNHALHLSSGVCHIVQAKLGGQAGMIGAAAYAKNKMSL